MDKRLSSVTVSIICIISFKLVVGRNKVCGKWVV